MDARKMPRRLAKIKGIFKRSIPVLKHHFIAIVGNIGMVIIYMRIAHTIHRYYLPYKSVQRLAIEKAQLTKSHIFSGHFVLGPLTHFLRRKPEGMKSRS